MTSDICMSHPTYEDNVSQLKDTSLTLFSVLVHWATCRQSLTGDIRVARKFHQVTRAVYGSLTVFG
jgi:hypothetical protein